MPPFTCRSSSSRHCRTEQNNRNSFTGRVYFFCVCEVHQCWRFIQEYGKRFAQVGRLTLDLKQDSNNKSGAENMTGGVGEIRERGRQDRNCRSSKVCAENTEFRGWSFKLFQLRASNKDLGSRSCCLLTGWQNTARARWESTQRNVGGSGFAQTGEPPFPPFDRPREQLGSQVFLLRTTPTPQQGCSSCPYTLPWMPTLRTMA